VNTLHENEKGFTLIEILAAVSLLSLILLTFTNLLGFTTLSFVKSDKKAFAVQLAENELIKTSQAIAFGDPIYNNQIVNDYEVTVNVTTVTASPSYTNIPVNLDQHVSLQSIVNDPNQPGVTRLVTVTVSWED
jgi:prepilin-type N-terminal cleavage/methylation domain-containing protein